MNNHKSALSHQRCFLGPKTKSYNQPLKDRSRQIKDDAKCIHACWNPGLVRLEAYLEHVLLREPSSVATQRAAFLTFDVPRQPRLFWHPPIWQADCPQKDVTSYLPKAPLLQQKENDVGTVFIAYTTRVSLSPALLYTLHDCRFHCSGFASPGVTRFSRWPGV